MNACVETETIDNLDSLAIDDAVAWIEEGKSKATIINRLVYENHIPAMTAVDMYEHALSKVNERNQL